MYNFSFSKTDLGYVCSYCGDGANDCAALKRASVGLSLSDLEASVAAPFTSQVQDISSVVELIREGRAALLTTIGMFKYMALYSMIQLMTLLILYWRLSSLADNMWLWHDMAIVQVIAMLFGLVGPYQRLSKRAPPRRLFTGSNLLRTQFNLIHIYLRTRK